MIQPRSLTLTLTLTVLALAPGCSANSPAPSSADKNAMADAPGGAAPQDAEAAAAPVESLVEGERELDDAAGKQEPARGRAPRAEPSVARDEAHAGSRVEIAEPMINGGLNRDIIRRKAQDHEDDIRACHAGDLGLDGTVAVKLSVDERGVVKDVELGDATDLPSKDTIDCILELLSGWSFAGEATGKASVELRFDLIAD